MTNKFYTSLLGNIPEDPRSEQPSFFTEDDSTLSLTQRRTSVDDLTERRYHGQDAASSATIIAVPANAPADGPCWRVELVFDQANRPPLRLEIAGAAVIGRRSGADIDLEPFDAASSGVSRRHAMLRPSPRALYLFDLGSTNGTRHNGILTGSGVACTLGLNDVIKLGQMTLRVRSLERVR